MSEPTLRTVHQVLTDQQTSAENTLALWWLVSALLFGGLVLAALFGHHYEQVAALWPLVGVWLAAVVWRSGQVTAARRELIRAEGMLSAIDRHVHAHPAASPRPNADGTAP